MEVASTQRCSLTCTDCNRSPVVKRIPFISELRRTDKKNRILNKRLLYHSHMIQHATPLHAYTLREMAKTCYGLLSHSAAYTQTHFQPFLYYFMVFRLPLASYYTCSIHYTQSFDAYDCIQ